MIRAHAVEGLVVCGLLAVCAGCGQPSAPAGIDPKADAALRRMSDTLGKAGSFSLRAEGVMDEITETGQLAQFHRTSDIRVQRPGRLFVKAGGDELARTVWFDQGSLTVLDERANEHATAAVPETVEAMMDFVVAEYGLTVPVADVLFKDSYGVLTANAQTGQYLGVHEVGEHACHHLAFRQEGIDWQIWIDAGDVAVPRKLVIVYKQEAGHPSYTVTMDGWDLSATFPADQFPPKLPAQAKSISMAEMFGVDEGEQR